MLAALVMLAAATALVTLVRRHSASDECHPEEAMSNSIDTVESRGGTATAPEPRPTEPGDIRVLIVDDQPGLPETIAAYIERETSDMEATVAQSALEAVTTLGDDVFDCIVSDYKMPAVSGLELLEAVRADDPDIPFIVFTGKGSQESFDQAFATDVTAVVEKRADTDQYDRLVSTIRQAVEQYRTDSEPEPPAESREQT